MPLTVEAMRLTSQEYLTGDEWVYGKWMDNYAVYKFHAMFTATNAILERIVRQGAILP
jgi:thiaminase